MHTGRVTTVWDGVSDFSEDDEPLEKILAIMERPPDGVTSPPPTAADVAAAILERAGPMDTYKLQRLCYYAQAAHLVRAGGKPLFSDRIEAWADGPIVRSLFDVHRGRHTVAEVRSGDASVIWDNASAASTVEDVLHDYGTWTVRQLNELSHREQPWLDAREGLPRKAPGGREITPESILVFYRTMQRASADDPDSRLPADRAS